jgi:ABC-type nitrate/sulfonate/bicarbonate transport system permease component
VNVMYGVRYFNPNLLETARSFNLNSIQTVTKVMIPGTVPYIAAGLRLSIGVGVVATVIAEMLLEQAGLGELLNYYGNYLLAPQLFSVILMIAMISVIFTEFGTYTERRYSRWKA